MNLTTKEFKLLKQIGQLMCEDNFGEFTVSSDPHDIKLTPEQKGVLGSLVKKGLVFDCYEGMAETMIGIPNDFAMYILTTDGRDLLLEANVELDYNTYE